MKANRLLLCLSVLAVSLLAGVSCSKMSAVPGDDYDKYGTIIVKGIVAGEDDLVQQRSLDGIKVSIDFGDGMYDTALTSEGGRYSFSYSTRDYASPRVITVIAQDVDGDYNGTYRSETKRIQHSSGDGFVGGNGSYYAGKKTIALDFLLIME